LSEGWIQASQELLEQMKKFTAKENMDRLDLVQSMRFCLYVLHRSLMGWMNWINNPDIMVAFKKEELDEMNRKISEFVGSFIHYDLEVTKMGVQKNLGPRKPTQEHVERRSLEDIFYV